MAIPAVVVGTGFGCRVHVPALRAAGFEVAALVGTQPERLARKAEELGIPAYFTDLDEAIARSGAVAVSIATPPSTHAPLARAALARGCHVLCEKPFTFDAAEAEALVVAAGQANVVTMIAHEFRWQPERALFGRAIAEGLIGAPRLLIVDQFLPLLAHPAARRPSWWFDEAAGGGWLGASGSHLIDQVRAWLSEIASLSARLLVVSDRGDVAEDSFSLRLSMASGVEVSMQQSAAAWGEMTTLWRCLGTKGSIWIDRGAVKLADASGTRELAIPPELCLPTFGDRRAPHEFGAFTQLAGAFAHAIEGGAARSAVPIPTFHDGLAVMRVIDAARRSSQADGELQRLR